MKHNYFHILNTFRIPHPYWITGFADAESYFLINVHERNNSSSWNISLRFGIDLNARDKHVLVLLQHYFQDIGHISFRTRFNSPNNTSPSSTSNKISHSVSYQIDKFDDIYHILIPFF